MKCDDGVTDPLAAGAWVSRDPQETFDLGARIGERLAGGEILLLDGPLGAGKTVFVKGVAAGLGVAADDVTSPSFTLVNVYPEGRLTLYHLDLYRLSEGTPAAHAVGLDDLLADERAVIVIEWAGRLKNYPLPHSSVWNVAISGDDDSHRYVTLSQPS